MADSKMADDISPVFNFNAPIPEEMARKAEESGVKKSRLDFISMFTLALLAGAFIALGAIFCTVVVTGASSDFPWGWTRLLGGFAFSLGLILVIVGGAELFTGNNLIIMAWAGRKVRIGRLLYNWFIVYLGNFVGAVVTAIFTFLAGHYLMFGGGVGTTALNIGLSKVNYTFVQAMMLGILCNGLVCLAVWLCYSARSTIDKILSIVFPITAFVACGFEHSIANMYFIPSALFIKSFSPPVFWSASGLNPADYSSLTWGAFFLRNLLPVSLGNIIGGSILVGLIYWLVYLRKR